MHFRSLSTRSDPVKEFQNEGLNIGDYSELLKLEGGDGGSEVVQGVIDSAGSDELILPVRAVISLLDGLRDVTDLPWWVVIASSTLALRLALFPLLVLQLKKLKTIGESFSKLPPPLPPPLSGRSYMDQISLFQKERKAIGCPSYLWFLAYFSVQIPCFLLWMTSIRRMSLDHHPGFDCGGTLWFQDLTEYSHGLLGFVFPLFIAGLHYTNIQISFRTFSVGKVSGLFSLLAKYYKLYLDLLTIPLFLIGFCVPQGSLIYWVTNSSLTLIQQLCLKHPVVLDKLRLPVNKAPALTNNSDETRTLDITSKVELLEQKEKRVSVHDLSAKELLALSVQLLAKGHKDRAIPLLRLALEKDPECTRALIVMGQTLLQDGELEEAFEYLTLAISKLTLNGQPTQVEEVDLLILALQWAGVACVKQDKKAEGIVYLQRVAQMEEPEDAKSKVHYYDALLLLASALFDGGRKAEAGKLLRMLVAYDPSYKVYLEEFEKDQDNFASDLASSRRGDY